MNKILLITIFLLVIIFIVGFAIYYKSSSKGNPEIHITEPITDSNNIPTTSNLTYFEYYYGGGMEDELYRLELIYVENKLKLNFEKQNFVGAPLIKKEFVITNNLLDEIERIITTYDIDKWPEHIIEEDIVALDAPSLSIHFNYKNKLYSVSEKNIPQGGHQYIRTIRELIEKEMDK